MTDPQQKAAFIQAQTVCANIEALGMAAENAQRAIQGESPAFIADDFDRVSFKYGIDHNSVCEFFMD